MNKQNRERGRLRVLGFLSALVGVSLGVDAAETPTFTRDIAPLFYKNCTGCHRPGEIAPMSLLTYEEARPWVKSIRQKVVAREMPPWKADPAHGRFSNDISLSAEEIDTITRWIDAGAPRGAPSDLPPQPKATEGWQLGEPDYVINLPVVDVPAEGSDFFPDLDVKLDLPEDRWVSAVEIRPGDRRALHHVVVFLNNAPANQGAIIPDFLSVWAVGTPPSVYPPTMGREIARNASLRMNMHYHSYGEPTSDQTRIGLHFGEGEMTKVINGQFAGTVNFAIPPHAEDYQVNARFVADEDMDIVSFFPHMHTRGKSMKYTAVYPDGRKEVLLNVPHYDFNWQWFYYPQSPVRIPEGTAIELEAHYDNSEANPNNPDPSIQVTFGEATYNEMMFGAFEFIPTVGREPAPINVAAKIDRILATHDPQTAYKVQVDLTRMNLTSGMVIPASGDGTWYIPFGRSLFEVPLSNIVWDGTNFRADLVLLGRAGVSINGSLSQDGSIQGVFDTTASEAGEAQPAFTGVFQPKSFAGKRVPTAVTAATGAR